jgi:hypothetical protein
MTNEPNKSAEAVRGKDDLPVMDPFGIPAWKRPFYFATDVIESYLDVFETTRQRSGEVVKRVAFACLAALIMTTVVIWNLRHITVFTP